jgi:hypothetical protein
MQPESSSSSDCKTCNRSFFLHAVVALSHLLSLSLSLANLPASSIAQCTQTLHQQMHQATLRTCTATHTTKQKKRIWTWEIFDLTSSVIHSLSHTFNHLAVQFLIHSFHRSLTGKSHSFILLIR